MCARSAPLYAVCDRGAPWGELHVQTARAGRLRCRRSQAGPNHHHRAASVSMRCNRRRRVGGTARSSRHRRRIPC
ncbi:hypothetical protein PhiBTCVTUL1a_29 [Burkholderia phage phiBtTUL1a]|nr:hypothetical protein PhiBTCVTUL1a_29 [Burkholderia phage phiBtTUL1a]